MPETGIQHPTDGFLRASKGIENECGVQADKGRSTLSRTTSHEKATVGEHLDRCAPRRSRRQAESITELGRRRIEDHSPSATQEHNLARWVREWLRTEEGSPWQEAGSNRPFLAEIVRLPRGSGTITAYDQQDIGIESHYPVSSPWRLHPGNLAEDSACTIPE
jgi:hypothetical protein